MTCMESHRRISAELRKEGSFHSLTPTHVWVSSRALSRARKGRSTGMPGSGSAETRQAQSAPAQGRLHALSRDPGACMPGHRCAGVTGAAPSPPRGYGSEASL